MAANPLPITYYEVAMEHQWARFRHAIRRDLAKLRADGQVGPINTVDSFNSSMMEAATADAEEMGAGIGRELGIGAQAALSMIAQTQPGVLESFWNAYNFAYHAVLNFELAGRKSFYFREGLTERLLATEVASDSDLIRLPFKACQFVFSSAAAIQALALIAAPAAVPASLAYDMPITVLLTELETPQYGGRSLIIMVVQASPIETRTLIKRQLLLAPGRSLAEALQTDWEDVRERQGLTEDTRGSLIVQGAGVSEVTDQPFYTDGLLVFRLILNAILYLSSDSAEVAERLGRKVVSPKLMNHAARRAAARESRLAYSSVGDSVQPIYIDADSAGSTGRLPPRGLKQLQHRLLVRGHWKQQVHGPQRSLRKLSWVAPYMRGPDVADQVNKPYLVR